jgi:NTE family protein
MLRFACSLLLAAGLASCAVTPDVYNGENAPRSAPIAALQAERPIVALALGSGGARGFAHVGVIKALEEAGIVPDIVTGASSGAVVAALYAGGMRAAELERTALELDRDDIVDFVLFGNGWVRGAALQRFINRAVGNRPIERLDRRFAVVATRAADGGMTVFNRGDTGLAVRASASVPNLFVPPVIRGVEYIDGGLASPVPAGAARSMGADIVIAVDVSWFAQARLTGGPEMERYQRRARYHLLEQELAQADVVITPQTVRARMLDFEHRAANIAAGEEAARAAVPQVRELIARVAAKKGALAGGQAAQPAGG